LYIQEAKPTSNNSDACFELRISSIIAVLLRGHERNSKLLGLALENISLLYALFYITLFRIIQYTNDKVVNLIFKSLMVSFSDRRFCSFQ